MANRFIFISNRAAAEDSGSRPAFHIWSLDLAAGSDKPVRLPAPINMPGRDNWSPSMASNGALNFGSDRTAAHGGFNIWVSHRAPTGYSAIEELGASINTTGNEVEPWIAPDGSYLIFSGTARKDSTGQYDLYFSRRINGVWQGAHPVGGVLTPPSRSSTRVSPPTASGSTSAVTGRWPARLASGSISRETTARSTGLATARVIFIGCR